MLDYSMRITYCYAKIVPQGTSSTSGNKSKPNMRYLHARNANISPTTRPKTEAPGEIKDKDWSELQKDRILKQSQSGRRDGETTIRL